MIEATASPGRPCNSFRVKKKGVKKVMRQKENAFTLDCLNK